MSTEDQKKFLRDYVRAIEGDTAAVFAGAGLSIPSGFCNWKELLRQIANDLGLDIDREHDLIALAQYHVNANGGRKNELAQSLINEFTKNVQISENHEILADLPIRTFWTTNYDKLIEKAMETNYKMVDVKRTTKNLSHTVPSRDVVIYKMHGDIDHPDEAVITKDDYDKYALTRSLFTTTLQGDLVSKTFYLLGLVSEDPNMDHILSQIKILLNEQSKTHYCLMKEVSLSDYDNNEGEFNYAKIKQELKIKDLLRYGVKVVLVDDYIKITELLNKIKIKIKQKNIFISGSAHEYGTWSDNSMCEFVDELSGSIIHNGQNIISGFGLGIGSAVISGVLKQLYKGERCKIEDRLLLRPFPQDPSSREHWTRYRKDMLSKAGIAIFVCGNKLDKTSQTVIPANGMLEEFELAVEEGVIPIPVATTEYVARILWDKVMSNFGQYVPNKDLKPLYESLGEEVNPQNIINIVIDIINKL